MVAEELVESNVFARMGALQSPKSPSASVGGDSPQHFVASIDPRLGQRHHRMDVPQPGVDVNKVPHRTDHRRRPDRPDVGSCISAPWCAGTFRCGRRASSRAVVSFWEYCLASEAPEGNTSPGPILAPN